MNVFNRVVTALLLLALLAVAMLLAVVPVQAIQTVQRGLTNFSSFLTYAQETYYWPFIAGRILLAILAVVLFGWLLWREFRRRKPKAVRLLTESGSKATVTTESVEKRLAWHIDQLADVISVTPVVSAAGKGVNVVISLETRPEIDVPMKTDEVVSVVREVITERMGLQLGKVQVHIKHAPYQEEA